MEIKRRSLTGGEVFGRLTVDCYSHSQTKKNGSSGERIMNCVCECGEKKQVRTSNLYSGNTQSCGCLQSEKTKASNIARSE